MDRQIGEAVSAWADLGPTQPSNFSARPVPPSARTVEIMSSLGLRYPPANSVDRDAHAARVALLAEDCADIPDEWLDEAAKRWAKSQPFFPRACELRDLALACGRSITRSKALPAPTFSSQPPKPDAPPLTLDEIKALPQSLIDMGVKLGEIDPSVVERIRSEAEVERSKSCPNYREGTRRCNCQDCRAYRREAA
jgi:hypothetical protein